jgi:hypothetical protein
MHLLFDASQVAEEIANRFDLLVEGGTPVMMRHHASDEEVNEAAIKASETSEWVESPKWTRLLKPVQ